MPYKVKLTDELFVPIAGTARYDDLNGNTLFVQGIQKGEIALLNEGYFDRAFDITFSAPGYHDFNIPIHILTDFQDITLLRKPSGVTEIIAGAAIVGALLLFFKK